MFGAYCLTMASTPRSATMEGIHTGGHRILDGFRDALQLLVGGQGIHGQIDLLTPGVGEGGTFGQLLRGEVAGRGTHAELGQTTVHRIRAVADGILQSLQIPRGGQ